ncbi:MAG: hypothetical protein M9893_01255 [Pyrinomonadaceae bacterium]|nr:hypothetical protein [Pyrinomonadaceae bacterium]
MGVGNAKRELIREFRGSLPAGISGISSRSAGCLVVQGPSYETSPGLGKEIAACGIFDEWQVIVLHDDIEFARSTEKFLWATWTRFDPARDIYAKDVSLKNNHIGYTSPIVIDARMKPWYPKEVEADEATVELVNNRWGVYFR